MTSGPQATATDSTSDLPSGHVIVCGMGHVGYRIVRTLMRLGECGTVIARQVSKDWQAAVEPRFRVILGDAREDELLREAGIERAKAILAVTDDDLANVAIALDARRLNPQIGVTLRIFDQDLAVRLEKSLDIDRALCTSALAAPAFIAAALGESVRGAFDTENESWIIEDEAIHAATTAGNLTVKHCGRATRTPIAISRGDELTIHPGPDVELLPGDRLVFLSPVRYAGAVASRAFGKAQGRAVRLGTLVAGVSEWWHETPRALRATLVVMLAIVLLSVGVFRLTLGVSLVDALYFTVCTITTVGYGDINLQAAGPLVKLYGCILMLCGAAILAVIVSLVTDLVLQTRLRDVIACGSARLKGHIIVAGLGNTGFRLLQGLVHSGERVVAIERREDGDFVQTARELVPVVLGNAKIEETLRKAGATGAKAVLAVTNDDIANLSIALATKRARPDCRVVARIFDSTLAEKMEDALGIDAVLNVSSASAPTFVGSILCPDVLHGLVLQDYLVLVFHRTLGRDCPGGPDCLAENETPLWVRRDGTASYHILAADDRPRGGDQIIGLWWRRFVDEASQP